VREGDDAFMRRALELAGRARGLTSPNPMVGAVVVRDGAVVGEAFHAAAGQPHAEILALEAAGAAAAGATLYVTLEPCVHHGRTPPCAPVVVSAGLRRVVVAAADPNPLVAGRGLALLRAAGLELEVGVLEHAAAAQNRAFFTSMRERRPHVTLKAAMTLDGRLADVHGTSRWITGEPARREAHRMRSEADAVLVGIGTVLRDDPELNVRLEAPWPREPYRVVLDTSARTPPAARLISAGHPGRALIAVGEEAPLDRVRALEARGASVVRCRTRGGRVDLGGILAALHGREIRAVLVEGGSEVHGAFLAAGLVDRVAVFLAPLLLGGAAAPGMAAGIGRELKNAFRLEAPSVRAVGDDLLIEADARRP